MNKKQVVFKAMQYIYEDPEAERIKKCRVLGRNLSNAIPADVLDFLIEIAEKNPKKIMDLYEGEDWKMQLFLMDAVDRHVVRRVDGIYKYDDKMLGGSMEATITFLRDLRYKALLDSIKRETYPELQPKQVIAEMESEITKDIPYFEDSVVTENPKKVQPKK
jgi:DNA polymerase/3'-5' exonuclease PolX